MHGETFSDTIASLYAVWCRRTDELVDGPNAAYMSSGVLDRWEDRLHDIFNGHPYDMLDAALTHTLSKFPLDIKVLNYSLYTLPSSSITKIYLTNSTLL